MTGVFEGLFGFALGGAFLEVLSFIVDLFAGPNAKLHLHQRSLEIDFQWNDRLATCLDLGLEAIQLTSFEKEFAGSTGFVIFMSSEFVLADMCVEQKKFVFNELGESLAELDFSNANGFDLSSLEGNPGLVLVGYEVLAASLRVADLPHPPRVFGFLGHSIGGSLVKVVG